MFTGEVLTRFEKLSPLTVQSRVLIEVALAPDALNAMFKKTCDLDARCADA